MDFPSLDPRWLAPLLSGIDAGAAIFERAIDVPGGLICRYASAAAAAFAARCPEEMVGRSIMALYPALPQDAAQSIVSVADGSPATDIELRYADDRIPDGWYRLRVVPLPGNCTAVVFRDRSRSALVARERALYREVFRGSSIGLHIYCLEAPGDPGSLRLIAANSAAATMAGISSDQHFEDIGKTFREFVPDILSTDIPAVLAGVIASGEAISSDLTYGDSKYRKATYRVRAWPLSDDCVAAAFENVTDLRALERRAEEQMEELTRSHQQLERSQQELRDSQDRLVQSQKMASLGRLSAGIAHEINNPLQVIKGYSGKMRDLLGQQDTVNRAGFDHCLDMVARSAHRLETIVLRMGEYSRNPAGEPVSVPVNTVVRDVAQLVKRNVEVARISLDVDLCGDEPRILGDRTRLEQVLVNLLVNARDAIEEAHPRSGGVISLATHRCDGDVQISVKDNGCGVADDVIEKIFDPFFTTKPPGKGTGLGLSIVHEIAREMGGRVECVSRPGEGACFRIVLPERVGDGAGQQSSTPARAV